MGEATGWAGRSSGLARWRARWVHWRLLGTLAGLALAVVLMTIAARGWSETVGFIDYPFIIDYGEGVIMSQVELLEAGRALYPESDREGAAGFVGANYPPLYYLAVFLTPTNPDSIYSGGRLLSFVSYLATAVLTSLLVWGATRRWPAGLVAGAAFLALPPAREWGLFAKPDLLALALSTAGLTLAVVAPRRVLWAALPFALALLTKQTMVAAPAAAVLALLLTPGRRRTALLLAGLTGGLALGPVMVLALGPADIVWHLVQANVRGWEWGRFDDISLRFLEIYRPMVGVALLGLPLAWRRRPVSPAVLYAPLTLLTLLAAGAPGSSRNYALEAGLGLAIGAGLAFGWVGQRQFRWQPALTLLVVALLGVQAATLWVLPERTFGRRMPTEEQTERRDVLLDFLKRGVNGPVLSEDVGLLVQAGLPVAYHDPSLMQKLAVAGIWNQEALLEEINRRYFSFILTEVDLERTPERAGRWTPEMVAAIRASYRVLYRDLLTIYAPR